MRAKGGGVVGGECADKRLRGAGKRSCVVDEAAELRAVSAPVSGCVVRAVSAVRKWSQGAGGRRLCIKGWRVRCD